MAFTNIQNAFAAGEVSPSLFGRTDLAKYHIAASTMRNFFANFRGGASSRAGWAYVGTSLQDGTDYPPRDIPFQFNINQGYVLEFGHQYMRIKSNGAYVVEDSKNITGATQANPCVLTIVSHGYSTGDWIFITGMQGMTNLNGLTWVVTFIDTNHISLSDLFGDPVDSTNFDAYTSGGTASRIFTVVSPYNAVDLPFLKYTQSKDTMSLTCVNQITNVEYPTYDLIRNGATDWTFNLVVFSASISPPDNVVVTAQSSTTEDTWYSYVVTAVDKETGEESIASDPDSDENNNIALFAGSNSITWSMRAGAGSYNVYKATPSYNVDVPIGSSYGYVGTAFGTAFVDTNITADFTSVPPVHADPFARGAIIDVVVTSGGSGYTQGSIGYTITTATGSGFVGQPVVVGGAFSSFVIENGGHNYMPGDTITITGSGGASATATLTIGPETGTYPGVVAYYQQRRAYANTLNNPDTYFMSQPGNFTNFDSSIPVTASDAITGAPWAQQINGIQFMVPMPGGLIIFTGEGAWQLNGGNNASITPIDQVATPQSYNGCHNRIQPIVANFNILYVQSKGSIVRDLQYNFYTNIYTGTDQTVLASHLFNNHQMVQWAYAEEPHRLIWVVRDDGILLCFTYLKEQDVYAWSRHDTNGQVVSVCSVTEPPSQGEDAYVDAVYVIVKRYVSGQWKYYSERMNNRNWEQVEDSYCVDSGLQWPMAFPDATLTPAAAEGTNNISSVLVITGGENYTSPIISAVDSVGLGAGATFSATLSGGIITDITVTTEGQDYTPGATAIRIEDDTGTGAIAQAVITNNITFTTDAGVFTVDDEGSVIRAGGGKATITDYISATEVIANITQPITQVIPNNPDNMPAPVVSGNWSLTPVTDVVTGLNHLEGMEVSILADGSVIPNQTVVNNSISLPQSYSSIIIGLPYICQLQSLYLDPQGLPSTIQGERKNIYSVIVRCENTRGISVGTNQPDASTQPDGATVPWTNMKQVKQRNALVNAGSAIPLFTGDLFQNVPANWDVRGQVAIQQDFPLPANILSFVSEYQPGDTDG